MSLGVSAYALSLLAGVLTTLSPCVLPLLPILFAAALSTHRLGPFALAAGVALSFAALGVLLAAAGTHLGLSADAFRDVGGVLLIACGVLLLSSWLQQQLARASAALSSPGGDLLARFTLGGLTGQFVLGLLLGAVWSPCVGPTLGAAVTLATQGRDLGRVALLMSVFGFGAALPMLGVASVSRAALTRSRGTLHAVSVRGKQLLGVLLIALGVLIVSGADRSLEAWLLDHSPLWLSRLTIRW